eukprot:142987-Pyramimonas_sp.AAC.2
MGPHWACLGALPVTFRGRSAREPEAPRGPHEDSDGAPGSGTKHITDARMPCSRASVSAPSAASASAHQ